MWWVLNGPLPASARCVMFTAFIYSVRRLSVLGFSQIVCWIWKQLPLKIQNRFVDWKWWLHHFKEVKSISYNQWSIQPSVFCALPEPNCSKRSLQRWGGNALHMWHHRALQDSFFLHCEIILKKLATMCTMVSYHMFSISFSCSC